VSLKIYEEGKKR